MQEQPQRAILSISLEVICTTLEKIKMSKQNNCSDKCWYCCGNDGELLFCTEFDTYVHRSCVEHAAKNKDDAEAQIIADEILGPRSSVG